jgi:ribosomal protein S14
MEFINDKWETLKISELNIHKIYISDNIIKTESIGELKGMVIETPTPHKEEQTKLLDVNNVDAGNPMHLYNNEPLKGKDKCLCEHCGMYKAKVFNYIYEMSLCRFCLREMTGQIEQYYEEVL